MPLSCDPVFSALSVATAILLSRVASVGLVLGVLAVTAAVLSANGARRWADATRMLASHLEAGRLDDKPAGPAPTTRYDARELEGLPAPVQRYLRTVLKDGQPIISAVTINLAGNLYDLQLNERSGKPGRMPPCQG